MLNVQRGAEIQKAIDDIKDISLCLLDPKEWAAQKAIKELKREERDDE